MTTKKLDLIIENETGGNDIVSKTIKPLKLRQLNKTLAIVLDIVKVLQEDDSLKDLFGNYFNEEEKKKVSIDELAELSDEELDEMEEKEKAEKDARFMEAMFKAAEKLMVKLPDQTLELLAALSNIDLELLEEQEIEFVFPLVEAIIEVNDMQKLIERGKQSLEFGKGRLAFLKPATAE